MTKKKRRRPMEMTLKPLKELKEPYVILARLINTDTLNLFKKEKDAAE